VFNVLHLLKKFFALSYEFTNKMSFIHVQKMYFNTVKKIKI